MEDEIRLLNDNKDSHSSNENDYRQIIKNNSSNGVNVGNVETMCIQGDNSSTGCGSVCGTSWDCKHTTFLITIVISIIATVILAMLLTNCNQVTYIYPPEKEFRSNWTIQFPPSHTPGYISIANTSHGARNITAKLHLPFRWNSRIHVCLNENTSMLTNYSVFCTLSNNRFENDDCNHELTSDAPETFSILIHQSCLLHGCTVTFSQVYL